MREVEEQIVTFQVCYNAIKNNFTQQKYDLHYLKIKASNLLYATSNFKMNENITFSRFDQEELVKLLADIRKLISAIEKEIEIQSKEDYYRTNNDQIL